MYQQNRKRVRQTKETTLYFIYHQPLPVIKHFILLCYSRFLCIFCPIAITDKLFPFIHLSIACRYHRDCHLSSSHFFLYRKYKGAEFRLFPYLTLYSRVSFPRILRLTRPMREKKRLTFPLRPQR